MDIIVGTAGHIDHGKTSLVRALTGVDADRLPEEKKRGITIDLGFAELDLSDVRIGFVDVPGHERFVKNMLAGAHGIDLVALVIAADEGVMPQTREHFDICRLLETKSGLIVITKTDTVDEELLELVKTEAEELVAGSFLENAPIVSVSAKTGAGLDQLKATLREEAMKIPARSGDTVLRLPVDRSFTMRGFGAVVTGTLVAGEINEGDELELLPNGQRVRVRGLQVHGSQVKRCFAGQRTAVNLGGIESSQIERGMVLAPASALRPTQIVDAKIEVLKDAPRALKSRSRVRVHIGAVEALARVRVLEESGEIGPGSSGFAQIRFETPIVAVPHERFIIRSYSPQHTIAGGQALDALALKHRGRETRIVRERLSRLLSADHAETVSLFIAASNEQGLRRADLAARTGWRDLILDRAISKAKEQNKIVDAEGVYLSSESFARLSKDVLSSLEKHHKREPLARGMLRETLREKLFAHAANEVFRAVLVQLETKGEIVSEKEIVRLASYNLELSPADAALRDRLEEVYKEAALEALTIDEAFQKVGITTNKREHGRKILQLLIDAGLIVRVAGEMFFYRSSLEKLVVQLRDYAAQSKDRLIDVPAFKDIAGVSRKYAIPLLEYFDREHITRRAGDKRIIL
jgi:selenocysteine-specific elongation factor